MVGALLAWLCCGRSSQLGACALTAPAAGRLAGVSGTQICEMLPAGTEIRVSEAVNEVVRFRDASNRCEAHRLGECGTNEQCFETRVIAVRHACMQSDSSPARMTPRAPQHAAVRVFQLATNASSGKRHTLNAGLALPHTRRQRGVSSCVNQLSRSSCSCAPACKPPRSFSHPQRRAGGMLSQGQC